jgi:hypothetical protein
METLNRYSKNSLIDIMNNLIVLLIAAGAAYVYLGQRGQVYASPNMVAEYRRVGSVTAPDDKQRSVNETQGDPTISMREKSMRSRVLL